jgi:hypothetical protein
MSAPKPSFLLFLPEDNADLAATSSQASVQSINDELGQLLRQPADAFWQTVKADRSLHACLDSYLRFRRWAVDTSWCARLGAAATTTYSWLSGCITGLLQSIADGKAIAVG